MKQAAPKSLLRRWLKPVLGLLLLALIPITAWLYKYGPWLAYLLATGPLGGATVIYTDTSCGNGEYRVVVYKYQSGEGRLDLTNRNGKVFDTANYGNGIEYTPFRWDANCKKVMVGSNEGLTYLEVK